MKFLGMIPAVLLAALLWCAGIAAAQDGPLPRNVLETYIAPPMSLVSRSMIRVFGNY